MFFILLLSLCVKVLWCPLPDSRIWHDDMAAVCLANKKTPLDSKKKHPVNPVKSPCCFWGGNRDFPRIWSHTLTYHLDSNPSFLNHLLPLNMFVSPTNPSPAWGQTHLQAPGARHLILRSASCLIMCQNYMLLWVIRINAEMSTDKKHGRNSLPSSRILYSDTFEWGVWILKELFEGPNNYATCWKSLGRKALIHGCIQIFKYLKTWL